MVVLFTAMGHTPPVVTEAVDWLRRSGNYVEAVRVAVTSDEEVQAYFRVAEAALRHRFRGLDVGMVELPCSDILSEEDALGFLSAVGGAMGRFRGRSLVVSVAGGRKAESVLLAVLGQLHGARAILHIVLRDVKLFNDRLEAVRSILREVGSSSDPFTEYGRMKDLLDPVMFPDPAELDIVEIPVLPYPRDVASLLVEAMGGGLPMGRFEEARVSLLDVVEALKESGFFVVSGGRVWGTERGRRYFNAVLRRL